MIWDRERKLMRHFSAVLHPAILRPEPGLGVECPQLSRGLLAPFIVVGFGFSRQPISSNQKTPVQRQDWFKLPCRIFWSSEPSKWSTEPNEYGYYKYQRL